MNGEIVKLPEVGKTYAFFDDGKSGFSRRYKAKAVAIFTRKEIEQNDANLYAAWLEQKENCDWICRHDRLFYQVRHTELRRKPCVVCENARGRLVFNRLSELVDVRSVGCRRKQMRTNRLAARGLVGSRQTLLG